MVVIFQLVMAILLVVASRCQGEKLDASESLTLKLLRKMDILEAKVKMLEEKNERLEKRSAQTTEMPVAFTAVLTQSNKPIGDHQTSEYDHVITNLGNGYEPRTGRFTCPVKGLYLFAVTAMSPSSVHRGLYTEVVKDGNQVSKMYSAATASSSTTSVFLITLDVGQMVWVRSTYQSNQIIHGDNYDTFAGTLIYQMS